jgi:hypothetical protein
LRSDHRQQRVQAADQRIQVTDRMRLDHRGSHSAHRRQGIIGREGARGDPTLQQTHLELERLVAAGEEGQCVGGRDVRNLAHRALALRSADVDRAIRIDAPEGGRARILGCGRVGHTVHPAR